MRLTDHHIARQFSSARRHLRTDTRPAVFCLILLCLVVMAAPRTTLGAGTPAGTVIVQQATAIFMIDGDPSPATVSSNVVSIIIAQVGGVNLAPVSGSYASRLNTVVDYPFVLSNAGNGSDGFSLAVMSSLALSPAIYIDENGDGLLSPPEIAAGPRVTTAAIPADTLMHLVARISIPDDANLIGQVDALTVSASSVFEPAKRAVAFRSTSIVAAAVRVSKSVSNTIPRAGERVTYTIAYGNQGSADAARVFITDNLDPRLRYVTGSSVPAPDTVSGQMLRWFLDVLPPAGTGSITFDVEIGSSVPAGVELHNIAAGLYNDGPTSRTLSSTETNFMTIQSGGLVTVDIGPDRTGTGEPGDSIVYGFVITNNSALPEAFDLSSTSTQGLLWSFYDDPAGDGRGGPPGPPITSTGTLPGGGQYHVAARTVLPVAAGDQTIDFTSFRVQSTTNQANVKSATGSTTVNMPVLSLVKAAAAPSPVAGSEIRYTITYTNIGHGQAFDCSVSDSLPAHTVYVPQSTTLNGSPKTDNRDADEVAVEGGVITVYIGTMPPNGIAVIEFRVRIL